MQYMKVSNLKEATHWIADEVTNNHMSSVTIGKPYKVYFDEEEQEYYIINDECLKSLIFLAHNGMIVCEINK